MTEWLGIFLDAALIAVVSAGVFQAIRLIRQLKDLRASRADMERFVRDFNIAVVRAENGIKALKTTARESGDDLEKLVEKANKTRDELTFIVESADSVAERLSGVAAKAIRTEPPASASQPAAGKAAQSSALRTEQRTARKPSAAPVHTPASGERAPLSRAEQELIQALKKLG